MRKTIRYVYVNVNVYVKSDFTVEVFFTASTFINVFSSSASHSFLKIIVIVFFIDFYSFQIQNVFNTWPALK